jgi:hypothetical protein
MVFLLNRHFTFAATAATPAPPAPGAGALVETTQKPLSRLVVAAIRW